MATDHPQPGLDARHCDANGEISRKLDDRFPAGT
jgi:hypothetical protein